MLVKITIKIRPSGVVVRGDGCYTKGPGFESRVQHGCQTVHPRHDQWLNRSPLNIGRRQVPGSIIGDACRPSCSEFSVVFSETCVNTAWDPLERPSRREHHPQAQVPLQAIGLKTYSNRITKVLRLKIPYLLLYQALNNCRNK